MEMQLIIVGILVAGAVLYIARATLRTWVGKPASSCGSGCGTCAVQQREPDPHGRFPLPQA
jgi:hypothetical protein